MKHGSYTVFNNITDSIYMIKKDKYMVTITDKGYPDHPGSMQSLVGIFNNRRTAYFVSSKTKEKYKLTDDEVKVDVTTHPTTEGFIDDFLKRIEKPNISNE